MLIMSKEKFYSISWMFSWTRDSGGYSWWAYEDNVYEEVFSNVFWKYIKEARTNND
jgi:hypothetical protein